MYPDAELRSHALNAVAIETARLRLAKEKASRKIDALAAFSLTCVDAAARSGRGRMGAIMLRHDADGARRVQRPAEREHLPPGEGFRRARARRRRRARAGEVRRLNLEHRDPRCHDGL